MMAAVLAAITTVLAVAWFIIAATPAPAHADALCDAMRARFGPGYPCISVPTNTFTPTAPAAPTTTNPGGQSSGGPQIGIDAGPGPGTGNGTPIVPINPTTPAVPTPTPVAPQVPAGPTQPGQQAGQSAPSTTQRPPATTPSRPIAPSATPAPAGTTDPVQRASLPTTADNSWDQTTQMLWLLGGAAAIVAGASTARGGGIGRYRAAATATATGHPTITSALRSWLPRGGSERATIGNSQLVLINDHTSPNSYAFDENVPPGGRIGINPDGSATVYDSNDAVVRTIGKPWAYDALGRPQRTWYSVDADNHLVQHVDAAPNALYPILADPPGDGTALGGSALGQATGKPEGSTWDAPLPDGGKIVNTIPEGNGDQTVDQTFYDAQGNITSTARVTSNGTGGYQRWGDNTDGSSGYQAQDAPNNDVYGGSWDSGADPSSDAPDSVYGQNWQATQSQTVRTDDDGTQTTVTSTQDNSGQWNHRTDLGNGSTVTTTSGPNGDNTTVTGQLDENGNGWVTDSNGNRADRYTDGNGNPVTVTTKPDDGTTTYYFTQDGQQRANTYDKYGNNTGSRTYNPDGTLRSGWETTNSGTRTTTYNDDGSVDITDHGNDVDWYKMHVNPDGSGTQHNGDFSTVDFLADGTFTNPQKAPDTRSFGEKTGAAIANYGAGFGRAALDSVKDLGTLTGNNPWDGADKGQATRDAWKGIGKTAEAGALYLARQGDLANSGNVPGLPQQGEAGTILRGVRDSFIARDDFARGDTAYGAGKASFNVISAIIGTKGAGAASRGAGAAGAAKGSQVSDGILPTGVPPTQGPRIGSIDEIFSNPDVLSGRTPEEIAPMIRDTPGWRVEELGKGAHQGQGWVLRQYNDRGNPTGPQIRWHPGGGHHGPDPYWRVVGPNGKIGGLIR